VQDTRHVDPTAAGLVRGQLCAQLSVGHELLDLGRDVECGVLKVSVMTSIIAAYLATSRTPAYAAAAGVGR
jgi:hypothetical protein